MGIQVGEKNPKVIKSEEIGQQYRQTMNDKAEAKAAAEEEQRRLKEAKMQTQQGQGMTPKTVDEEKAALSHDNATLNRIMALPEEEQPQALREAGYPLFADQKAKEVADKVKREKMLAEIMAMPEEDRVGALLDAGFTQEAAAENKRLGEARKWSQIISLLGQYGFININNEETHAILEHASNMPDNESRIAYCKENGLAIVANVFTEALNGTPLSKIDKSLYDMREKEAAAIKAAAEKTQDGGSEGGEGAAGDGAPAPEAGEAGKPADEGSGDGAPANEKKKPGRPAGSTKK